MTPGRATIGLVYPIEIPGGTLDKVTIDLDRPGSWGGDRPVISRITGLPAAVLDDMAEFDYVAILLKIEQLNAPRLAMAEAMA
jgi:hypothetical protein